MRDLEKEIAKWRRQMAAGGIKSPQLLDELESHLREEIARQSRAGAESIVAFQAAVERIGRAVELKTEFTKAASRKHWWQAELSFSSEQERKLMGVLILATGCLIAGGMSTPILFRLGSCSDMNTAQQTLGVVAAILIGVTIGCGKFVHRFLPAIASKRIRAAASLAAMVVIIAEFNVLFYVILPRVTLTESELIVVILWATVPCAVVVGIGAGIEEATHRRLSSLSKS